ncbi:65kDa B protein-domain-containing protein [Nemania sp. NC0429]|nr:65kDa B protein-domain-containing protein [Nemania sp. NC0429]
MSLSRYPLTTQPASGGQATSHGTQISSAPKTNPGVNGKHTVQASASPFRVDAATGAVSVSIPTVSPFGRENSALTPNPELIYNSLGGNGPFGIGWTIALPEISRKTSQHVPTYTDDDVFVLSGAEDLVRIPTGNALRDGYAVQQYRPRVQHNASSVRIERWTSQTDASDQFWRTLADTGSVTLYGRGNTSRIFDPNSEERHPRTFSWLPTVTYDLKGNVMIYCYKEEDSANVDTTRASEQHRTAKSRTSQRYLKRILYCNKAPFLNHDKWITESWQPAEGDYLFEVILDYGEHDSKNPSAQEASPWLARADVVSTYHAGFEVRTYRLCHRLLLFHHFPNESTSQVSLVSSADLEYREMPSGSELVSVTQNGHRGISGTGEVHTESLPPIRLEYSAGQLIPGASPDDTILPVTVDTSHLAAIPQGHESLTQWVDLNGEGSPGILTQLVGGEWVYIRNESQAGGEESHRVAFGPSRVLQGIPNLLDDGESGFFTQLAADGTLQFVHFDPDHGINGYYPRVQSTETWGEFTPFAQIPAIELSRAAVRWIDLVGNGRSDAVEFLVDDHNRLRWHPSLGYDGFAPALSGEGPRVPQEESSASAVVFADMTGDGLTDVVYVCSSSISYWPNLGYGRFGARIQMDNSPLMDAPDLFTTKRVILADVDGSGSADMIYLTPGGGANIYLNHSGNAWADPIFLESVPELSGLTSIDVVDILGQGVPCLCWTFPNPHGSSIPVLQYVELMGQIQPNRLTKYCKGTVLETSIEYSPSTQFYLSDEKAGHPWTTKLPFPVQCVQAVNTTDHVAKTKFAVRYAYHDGFYDHFEREFRGFGHVDCWDTEDLAAAPGLSRLQAPPCHSRTWHYTGAPLCETSPDHWTGNEAIRLEGSQLPVLPEDSVELREARRAMKGLTIRTELYGDQALAVLEISLKNYTVLMEHDIYLPGSTNPFVEQPHACFRVLEREVLRKSYERDPIEENACIHHQLNLVVNQNGQPTKSIAVHYGRRNAPSELDSKTRALQEQAIITYIEHDYTNPVDEPNALLSPQTGEVRSYRVRGVQLPQTSSLFSFEQLSQDDSVFFRGLPTLALEQDPGPLSDTQCKVLTAQTRSYYRSSDMSARLASGKVETFSVLDQSYTLALTKECLSQVLVDEDSNELLSQFSASDGAYTDLNNDGNWWIPSSRARYGDPKAAWDPSTELEAARSHLYIPEYTVNARGAVDYHQLDSFSLFRSRSVDAVGNETRIEYEYPFKEPVTVTDPNDNVTEFAYDCFHVLVGTAVKGKKSESLGDSIEGFEAVLSADQLAAFVGDPLETAPKLLAAAGSRSIYSRHGTADAPAFMAEIERSTHSSSAPELGDFSISFTYFDGRGNVAQKTVFHNASPTPQWRLEGWQINDTSHSNTVLGFYPCFTDDHRYRPRADQHHKLPPAVYSISDPLGRLVAILHPDHGWGTQTIGAWETVVKNAGDNLLAADMAKDSGVGDYIAAALDPDSYLPTWYSNHTSNTASAEDKAAAQKSRTYNETPDLVYTDPQGSTILTVTSDQSPVRRTARAERDAAGSVSAEFDNLDRAVCRSQFDSCQRLVFQEHMDGRVDLFLPDALGLEWLRWTRGQQGHRFRVENDDVERPKRVWLSKESEGYQREKLIVQHYYGEGQAEDKADNLRGRVYRTLDQAGSSTNVAYDFKGNLVRHDRVFATDYKSVLDWSSPMTVTQQLQRNEIFTDYASYDALSRPCQTIAVDGSRIARTYNVSGQLDSLQAAHKDNPAVWTDYITSIEYTASGQQDTVSYGNGVSTSYTYDSLTLLESRRTVSKPGRTSTVVFRDVYTTYDCLGKRVYQEDQAQQDVYFRNQVIRPINDYTYDAREQLVIATGREKINAVSNTVEPYGPYYALQGEIPSDDQLREYTDNISYDSVGNISQMQHASGDRKVPGWTRNYEYGTGNRLSVTRIGRVEDHYTYNYRGAMISTPGAPSMTWNHADQLRSTTSQRTRSKPQASAATPETTWYVYDSSGTRVRKVTERAQPGSTAADNRLRDTLYLRQLAGFEVYREYTGRGEVKTEKKTLEVSESLPSPDSCPVATVEDIAIDQSSLSSAPASSLLLKRYLLDQGLEVDHQGKLLSLEEYSPYGATTFRAMDKKKVQTTSSYRFSNYLRDTEETGFYFCHTRYLASWLGRWISPDPLGTADGLNMYRYVSNDPVNFMDSSGTMQHRRGCGGGRDDGQRPSTSRGGGGGGGGRGGGGRGGGGYQREGRPRTPIRPGTLGIQRHVVEFDGRANHLWSSVVDFDGPVTNQHLVLASQMGYIEMVRNYYSGHIRGRRGGIPTVMTAYRMDSNPNRIILSSSTKSAGGGEGSARRYYERAGTQGLRDLMTTTAQRVAGTNEEGKENPQEAHRAGSCGEIGAINLAFIEDAEANIRGTMTTWGQMNQESEDPVTGQKKTILFVNKQMNPCGRTEVAPSWGCYQMLRAAGITGLRTGGVAPAAQLPAPRQVTPANYPRR